MGATRVVLVCIALGVLNAGLASAQDLGFWYPTSLAETSDPAQWPVRFETMSLDCGRIHAEDGLVTRFRFVNISAQRIEPQQHWNACGGWSMRWSKARYEPGESGEIEVTCRSAIAAWRHGPASRVIPLTIKGFEGQRMAIETRVYWIPRILEPSTLVLPRTRRGGVTTAAVQVAGRAADFQVTEVVSPTDRLSARVIGGPEAVEAEGETFLAYSIEVAVQADAPVGRSFHVVRVRTNDDRASELRFDVRCEVVGEVFVGGDRHGVLCEVTDAEEATGQVSLQSWSGRPFRVTGIQTDADERFSMEDVELDVAAGPSAHEIGGDVVLRVRAKLLNPERRWWIGWAKVVTDFPGEEPVLVPITLLRKKAEGSGSP